MNTAKKVEDLIAKGKASGENLQKVAWDIAMACVGWAYVFGARGEYCDPSNRRAKARDDHPTIKSKCKNFNGSDQVIGNCSSCQWYPGGRTRFFDCRGFTYWILLKVYDWKLMGAGATSQWNNADNWSSKGSIADGSMPKDTLVCLFVKKGNVMEHTGFGYNNETLECSCGVQYFKTRNKKWTNWAVPKCVTGEVKIPEKEPESTGTPTLTYPTIRQGAKGEVVVQLQTFLAKDGSNLEVDGIFGSGTASAVRAFQKRHGLAVDGVVGPKTWAKLLEVAGNIKIPTEEDSKKSDKDLVRTLIIPNLPDKEARALFEKYPNSVFVEYEDVEPYMNGVG